MLFEYVLKEWKGGGGVSSKKESNSTIVKSCHLKLMMVWKTNWIEELPVQRK